MRRAAGWGLILAAAAYLAGATSAWAQDAATADNDRSNEFSTYGAIRLGAGSSFATRLRTISPRVDSITGQDRASDFAVASVAAGFKAEAVPLRFELEASWRGDARHRIGAVGTCTVALCGQDFNFRGNQTATIGAKSLLMSAFYDHPLADGTSLFIGAGVGIARLRSSAVQRFDIVQAPQAGTQIGAIWPKRTSTNLAFSLTAGLAKRFDRDMTFELGGRYVNMGRYDTGYNANLFADERFSARLASAEGFLGIRFGF